MAFTSREQGATLNFPNDAAYCQSPPGPFGANSRCIGGTLYKEGGKGDFPCCRHVAIWIGWPEPCATLDNQDHFTIQLEAS